MNRTLALEEILDRCWTLTEETMQDAALHPDDPLKSQLDFIFGVADCFREANRWDGTEWLRRRLDEEQLRFQQELLRRHPEWSASPPPGFEGLLLHPGILDGMPWAQAPPDDQWDPDGQWILAVAEELVRVEYLPGDPFYCPVAYLQPVEGFLAWEPPYASFRCRCGAEFRVRGFPEQDDPDRLFLGFDGGFFACCRECWRGR